LLIIDDQGKTFVQSLASETIPLENFLQGMETDKRKIKQREIEREIEQRFRNTPKYIKTKIITGLLRANVNLKEFNFMERRELQGIPGFGKKIIKIILDERTKNNKEV